MFHDLPIADVELPAQIGQEIPSKDSVAAAIDLDLRVKNGIVAVLQDHLDDVAVERILAIAQFFAVYLCLIYDQTSDAEFKLYNAL